MVISYDAVFVIGFGGPEKKEDIRPFLEIVTKGRRIPPERIEEVVHHYELIGGASPINAITNAQAAGLHKELTIAGDRWQVYVGNRNWHPFIEDTLKKMMTEGVKRAIGFYTAAHRSEASLERYWDAVEEARKKIGPLAPVIDFVGPWFDHPLFIQAIVERVKEVLPDNPGPMGWLFTAHSIPCAMAKDSTYVIELQKTAALVAEQFGSPTWKIAYSSRSGNPRDPWLTPDIRDEIRDRAKAGEKKLMIIPIGFVADHVEVLFDLDVEAKAVADEVGVTLYRAKTVGDHHFFCTMIADVVKKRADEPAVPEMTSSAITRFQKGSHQSAPGRTSSTCYCQPGSKNPPCR
jgi:protoporphyrin/coproporphyrin ferrochelatase